MITKEQIDRINALAKKNKEEGLTPEETAERDRLRKEYVASFRENLKSQLENIDFVDENGKKIPASEFHIQIQKDKKLH